VKLCHTVSELLEIRRERKTRSSPGKEVSREFTWKMAGRQIFCHRPEISYRAKRNRATKRTQKVSQAITIPLKSVNECAGFVLTGVINEAMKPLFGSA